MPKFEVGDLVVLNANAPINQRYRPVFVEFTSTYVVLEVTVTQDSVNQLMRLGLPMTLDACAEGWFSANRFKRV